MNVVREHVARSLPDERQRESRLLILDKGSVPLCAHLAKVAGGAEVPVRSKTAVIVGDRKRACVRCHPHLTLPGEWTERIA